MFNRCCVFSTFCLDGSGIVNQTKGGWLLSLERPKQFKDSFLFARHDVGREGSTWPLHARHVYRRWGKLCALLTQIHSLRLLFHNSSLVKSENVLCTITQANTMSQDKYALLVAGQNWSKNRCFLYWVWLPTCVATLKLFLNYVKGLAPARKLRRSLRALWSSAELKLKQLESYNSFFFFLKSHHGPFFPSQWLYISTTIFSFPLNNHRLY